MIEIRRCRSDEIPLVMQFIDRHWQSGHALATSRALMDWQHGGSDGSHDYLVALRGDEVLGILGYIATRRFDPALAERNVLWLALWKVLENTGVSGLGLRMLGALAAVEPHATIAVNGINAGHPPMYRALRYVSGELQRHYVVNPNQPRRLLAVPEGSALPVAQGGGSRLEAMTEAALLAMAPAAVAADIANPKTPLYFCNRFLRHPFYAYRVFQVVGDGHRPALLAIRVAEHDGARALRIVDFAGDPAAIAAIGGALANLMDEEQAEFADFWQSGLPDIHFEAAGFARLDPDGPVVVPNYFEPFVQRNGRLLYAVKTTTGLPVVICRADGDQDRPNRLPGDAP